MHMAQPTEALLQFTTASSLTLVTGTVTTFAGNATGGYGDGMGAGALFSNPIGIASDATG